MRRLRKVLSFLLVLTLLGAIPFASYASDSSSNERRLVTNNANYDVVFAIDESSSMDQSDPSNVRHSAGSLFTSLVASERSRLGYVTFTEQVNEFKELTELNLEQNVDEISNLISGINRSNYSTQDTDMSMGLRKALDLIKEAYNFDGTRNPCIILLSDGNTDFVNGDGSRTIADADKDLDSVLNEARSLGVKIYTVGLNWNGELDQQKLADIAAITGGQTYPIKDANEFPNTLINIFADLGGVTPREIGLRYDAAVKRYTGEFTIESSNYLSANIAIPKNLGLSDPQLVYVDPNTGNKIPKSFDGTDIILKDENDYLTIKINSPEQGTWELSVAADDSSAGENITISLVTMNDITFEITEAKASRLGGLKVIAEFNIQGKPLDDPDEFSDTPAYFTVKAKDGTIIVDNESVAADKDGSYTLKTRLKESGDYVVTAVYDKNTGIESLYKETLPYTFTASLIPIIVLIIAGIVLLLLIILIILLIKRARKPKFTKDLTIGLTLPVQLQKETPIPVTIAMPYKKSEAVLGELIMTDQNAGRVLQNILAKTQMNDLVSKIKFKAVNGGRLEMKIGPKLMGFVQVSNQNVDPAKATTFNISENVPVDIAFSADGQTTTVMKLTYGNADAQNAAADDPFGGSGSPFGGSDIGSPFGGSDGGFGGAPFGGSDGGFGGAPFGGSDGGFGGAPFGGSDGGFGGAPFGGSQGGNDNGFGGSPYGGGQGGSDNGFGGSPYGGGQSGSGNGFGGSPYGGGQGGSDNGFGGSPYGGNDGGFGGSPYGGGSNGSSYGGSDQTQRGNYGQGGDSQGFDFNGGSSGSGNDYNNIF